MLVTSHRDLIVFQNAFSKAMEVFALSKAFPKEERYSLTYQIRCSSRSVSANIAEAWQKRRYKGSFIAKLTDAMAEAAETQTWLDYASSCGYADAEVTKQMSNAYDDLLRSLNGMILHSEKWCLK